MYNHAIELPVWCLPCTIHTKAKINFHKQVIDIIVYFIQCRQHVKTKLKTTNYAKGYLRKLLNYNDSKWNSHWLRNLTLKHHSNCQERNLPACVCNWQGYISFICRLYMPHSLRTIFCLDVFQL